MEEKKKEEEEEEEEEGGGGEGGGGEEEEEEEERKKVREKKSCKKSGTRIADEAEVTKRRSLKLRHKLDVARIKPLIKWKDTYQIIALDSRKPVVPYTCSHGNEGPERKLCKHMRRSGTLEPIHRWRSPNKLTIFATVGRASTTQVKVHFHSFTLTP